VPQAPAHLQAKFRDDAEACDLLEGAGYTLYEDFTWRAPMGYEPLLEELDAVEYLRLEWDFGGLREWGAP